MKIALFVLGIVVCVAGFSLTAWTWYNAAHYNRLSEPSAYAGPVLIILGALRMVRAASTVSLPSFIRLVVVGIAILVGYGDSAAIKATFPNAQEISSANNH